MHLQIAESKHQQTVAADDDSQVHDVSEEEWREQRCKRRHFSREFYQLAYDPDINHLLRELDCMEAPPPPSPSYQQQQQQQQ
jgi:hypothetical protein